MKISYNPFFGLTLFFEPHEVEESIAILNHIKGDNLDDSTSPKVLDYFAERIRGESKLVH